MKISTVSLDCYLLNLNDNKIDLELLEAKLDSLSTFDGRVINLILELSDELLANDSEVNSILNYVENYPHADKVNLLGIRNSGSFGRYNGKTATLNLDSNLTVKYAKTLVVDKVVRSGQIVYNNGDVLVLDNVSSSAEIIASGNIYMYGVNNGRLYAGCNGDKKSYIFMKKFGGELISVSDNYKLIDNYLGNNLLNKDVKIYLNELDRLIVEEIK